MGMVTIRLSDDLKARIDALAEKSGRSKSYFVRELIIRGIEEFEEDYRDLEAIRAYLAAGGRSQKMISMKDLSIELGLDKLESKNNSSSRKTTKKASQTSRPKTAKPAKPNSRKS